MNTRRAGLVVAAVFLGLLGCKSDKPPPDTRRALSTEERQAIEGALADARDRAKGLDEARHTAVTAAPLALELSGEPGSCPIKPETLVPLPAPGPAATDAEQRRMAAARRTRILQSFELVTGTRPAESLAATSLEALKSQQPDLAKLYEPAEAERAVSAWKATVDAWAKGYDLSLAAPVWSPPHPGTGGQLVASVRAVLWLWSRAKKEIVCAAIVDHVPERALRTYVSEGTPADWEIPFAVAIVDEALPQLATTTRAASWSAK